MSKKKNANRKKKEEKNNKNINNGKLDEDFVFETIDDSEIPFPDGFEDNLGNIGREKEEEEKVILMGPPADSNEKKSPKVLLSNIKDKVKFKKTIKSDKSKNKRVSEDNVLKHLNLGRIFLGISIVFLGLIFLGQKIGWFGSLDIHFLKLWPLLLIFIGLSIFKVEGRRSKIVGVIVTILVFLLAFGLLLGSGNVTNIVLSDNVVEEEREIEDFSNVIFEGIGNIEISQGGSVYLLVKADENIISEVVTDVDSGVLRIRYRNPFWNLFLFDKSDIDIKLIVKDLESIEINGFGSIVGISPIKTDDLDIVIVGSGEVKMDVEVDNLVARIIGSGEFDLSGYSDRQLIYITGSGKYDSENLESSETGVRISGSGDAIVNVKDELDVSISGSGSVIYKGDPIISRSSISGSGSITKKGSGSSILKENIDFEAMFDDLDSGF